tara:strand:- start:2490 stop:3938 length:1449 start_codon:yes stop_codon:yes gene_type:complete
MAKQEIVEAIVKSNIGEVADGLDKAKKSTKELADSTKDADKGFGRVGKAVKGIGTALKAAGIGIVVGLFVKMMDVFRQNQKVVDTFNTAMQFLNIAFNDLFKFLEGNIGTVVGYFKSIFKDPVQSLKNFGNAIVDNVIERFNSLMDVFGHLGDAFMKFFARDFEGALSSLKEAGKESVDVMTGVDDSVDKITETVTKGTKAIKDYAKGTLEAAENLVELNKSAEIAAALNQQIIEQKDREAEIQRQIRDDETRSMEDRMAASQKLKNILDDQEKAMLANAKAVTDAAQAQFDLTKNDADHLALIQAQTEEAAVLAQIEGFRSEQKSQDIALTKEQSETLKEQKQVALDNAQAQLEAYGQLAGALSGLAGENKALAVAGAIIDTYAGANKAFAAGGPAGFVTGAAIIATGLANVRKILQTDVGSGSGGSVPSASAETPAPQMLSGAFDLGGVQAPEPVQAFVVTDDMTNSQDKLANIRRRASI